MNNPTRGQRLTPLTATPELDPKRRKQKTLTPEQTILREELKSTWDFMQTLGHKLNARKMSRDSGHHESLAGQYLNGGIPLNTEAMLWFAQHMGMAPQEIWGSWRYRSLTNSPSLVILGERWSKLSLKTRIAITELASRDDSTQ